MVIIGLEVFTYSQIYMYRVFFLFKLLTKISKNLKHSYRYKEMSVTYLIEGLFSKFFLIKIEGSFFYENMFVTYFYVIYEFCITYVLF